MGGVYIVVRGLDNIDQGLPERWRPAWRRIFGDIRPAGDSYGVERVQSSRRNIDRAREERCRPATEQREDIDGADWRAWRVRADRRPRAARRGRYLNTICQLDIGADTVLLRIIDGRIAEVRRGPFVKRPSAVVRDLGRGRPFGADCWPPDPPPGDHDLLAFVKRRELRLTGDLHPLMSHLLYFKGVLGHLREASR